MINIYDDIIEIKDEGQSFKLLAIGGPDEPIEITYSRNGVSYTYSMSPEEVEQLQLALLNFRNTGYFDQEG